MVIHWRNGDQIDEVHRQRTEQRLEVLAERHDDLFDVTISIKSSGHHRHGGQEAHIVCHARGRDLIATRSRPDASLALNDALDALEREIRDLRDRRSKHPQRGERIAEPPEGGEPGRGDET